MSLRGVSIFVHTRWGVFLSHVKVGGGDCNLFSIDRTNFSDLPTSLKWTFTNVIMSRFICAKTSPHTGCIISPKQEENDSPL